MLLIGEVFSGLGAQAAYGPFVDMAARQAGPQARSLLDTYFACGDLDDLTGLFGRAGLRVTGNQTHGGTARFVLNGDMNVPLTDGKLVPTPGLRLAGDEESGWVLALDGDKEALANLELVLTYKAGV